MQLDDTTKAVANDAKTTAQNSINSFDPTAAQNNFLNNYNATNATQQKQTQDFQNQYAQSVASNPTAMQYYQQGNDLYNVGGLSQQANQLTNAVLTAPQTNLNAARGFNYDSNQLGQQTNQDLARLSPLQAAAQNNLQTAQGLAAGYANAGMQQTNLNLLPIQASQQFLMQQQGSQQTAQMQANQQQMDALTAKLSAGLTLSASEYAQYNQLVQSQTDLQKQQLANQGTLANTIQTQKYQSVPSTSNLVNTFAQGIVNPATGAVRTY